MTSPGDSAHEANVPEHEGLSTAGPDDHETEALDAGFGYAEVLDLGERDLEALIPDIRSQRPEVAGGEVDDLGDVEAGKAHAADRQPVRSSLFDQVEIPEQYGGDEDWADHVFDDPKKVENSGKSRNPTIEQFEVTVEEAGIESDDRPDVDDIDADDPRAEVYDYDEEADFDPQTTELARVPSDLLRLYVNDMQADILTKEQVIDRAKDVEAGLTADWMLHINAAVDDPDPDALLNLRDDYIEARRENMRLASEGDADDDGSESDSSEANDQDDASGPKLSKNQRLEQRTARNKEIKYERAIEEVDDMIALALRQRVAVEPGRTELPEVMRDDLEDMVEQGKRAKTQMIRSIERWTFQESMKFGYRGGKVHLTRSDLTQEGSLGAIRAVMKFDYTRGFSLTTYSADWTKKFIGQAIEHGQPVRLPTGMPANLAKIHRAEEEVLAKLQPGDEMTEEAIATVLQWSPEKLAEVRKYDQMTVSLDSPIGAGSGATLADMRRDSSAVDPYQVVASKDIRAKLPGVIDEVLTVVSVDEKGNKDPRIEEIIRYRFALNPWQEGKPLSQADIAEELGISQMHVGRLEKKGLARIRQNPELMDLLQAYRG